MITLSEDWTYRYFVKQSELFRIVMDSSEMVARGRVLAEAIGSYLAEKGYRNAKILDIGCGTGRIALPLASMGFNVVGIDISPSYIEIAKRRAEELGVSNRAIFIVCDAREIEKCVREYAPFDVFLFVWTTVLGYYDEETDQRILKQLANLAHENSLLIVADTASKDFISFLSNFVGGYTWFVDYGEHVVVERPMFNPATGTMITKQIFYRKSGKDLLYLGEATFQIKLYSLDELVSLARSCGWCLQEAFRSFISREPYRTLGAINAVFKICRA